MVRNEKERFDCFPEWSKFCDRDREDKKNSMKTTRSIISQYGPHTRSLKSICKTMRSSVILEGFLNFLSFLVDQDECQNASTNNCDKNAMCNNTVGSFECFCKEGFTGNGRTCQGNNDNKLKLD